MTVNLDKIKTKIQALAAKTVSAGCTEEEANAAMVMVGKLLAQYNLTLAETQTIREEKMETGGWPNAGKRSPHWSFVFVQIAKFTHTKVWNDIPTNQTRYFGLEPDVMMACYLHQVVNAAIKNETDRFHSTTSYLISHHKRVSTTSFQRGLALRVTERLKPPPATTGTALVVTKNALVTEAFAKLDLNLKASKSGKKQHDPNAFAAGKEAGNRVNLGRPLGGSTEQQHRITA